MKKIILVWVLVAFRATAQEVAISSVDQLWEIALARNVNLKNSALQNELAALTRKVASINAFSPRVPVSWQALDNIALQRTLVPGTIFGQPEGTYKELVMGQKYAATLNFAPQFDILHLGNLAQRKWAALEEERVQLEGRKAERDLLLEINAAFHNVMSYDYQRVLLVEQLQIGRQILGVIEERWAEGVARSQERNEAQVNVLTLEKSLNELDRSRQIQLELLQLLTKSQLHIAVPQLATVLSPPLGQSSLEVDLARAQWRVAQQDETVARKEQWPVVSAISSFNWQNLGNTFFYGPGGSPIYYAYIGLKLSWDLPTTMQKWSNAKSKGVQRKVAANALQWAEQQEEYAHLKRNIEFEKSMKNWEYLQQIEDLKQDTFEKNFSQFEENILALDELLRTQSDRLAAGLNKVAALVDVHYNHNVIRLNNRY